MALAYLRDVIFEWLSGRNASQLGVGRRWAKAFNSLEDIQQIHCVVLRGWTRLSVNGHGWLASDDGQGRIGTDPGLAGQDDNDQKSDRGYESRGLHKIQIFVRIVFFCFFNVGTNVLFKLLLITFLIFPLHKWWVGIT